MCEIADRILGITTAGRVNTIVFFNGEMLVDFKSEFGQDYETMLFKRN